MKLILLILLFTFNAQAVIVPANFDAQRRQKIERERFEKMMKICSLEKAKLKSKKYICPKDLKNFLVRNYYSYMNHDESFNECMDAKEEEVSKVAERDTFRQRCMQQAIKEHPEYAKEVARDYWIEKAISFSVIIGIILLILKFILRERKND